jgi:hypothetical protein
MCGWEEQEVRDKWGASGDQSRLIKACKADLSNLRDGGQLKLELQRRSSPPGCSKTKMLTKAEVLTKNILP